MFHLNCELPQPSSKALDSETASLTAEEKRILKQQIQRNSSLVSQYVMRLDLLVNKEKYPRQTDFVCNIRQQLEILMEENDTFREVLWRHEQGSEKTYRKSA